jgi:predicted MPP superfamily phosphohydrolase
MGIEPIANSLSPVESVGLYACATLFALRTATAGRIRRKLLEFRSGMHNTTLMRVAFTSDLHIDITAHNRELLPYLVEEIERLSPDALVLAGDIANKLSGWDVALEAFRPLGIMKFIVPGNHDIWIESKRALERAQDSTWKYNVALPASAVRHGFHYLPQHPLLVGDLCVPLLIICVDSGRMCPALV